LPASSGWPLESWVADELLPVGSFIVVYRAARLAARRMLSVSPGDPPPWSPPKVWPWSLSTSSSVS
jgi:hypothetical protein